jgi:hypothetical protein
VPATLVEHCERHREKVEALDVRRRRLLTLLDAHATEAGAAAFEP